MTGGITLWKDRGYEVEIPRSLTAEQRDRYSRHLLIPEIGAEGQQKLLDAQGAAARRRRPRLADGAVPRRGRRGTLGIVDDDVVDLSNLQRQVIHTTDRVGVPKVDSAERGDQGAEPRRQGRQVPGCASSRDNIMDILPDYDIVVDGLDNFPTRYLLNDASVRLRIPVVSAAILGFDGQLSVFKPYEGPCYRCLFPVPPPAELAPSCGANGVIGVLPGDDGPAAGDRGRQADPRHRRPADRPPADVRRARPPGFCIATSKPDSNLTSASAARTDAKPRA